MNEPNSERLHALVVSYRRPGELARVLDALSNQTVPPDTTTVIDNGDDAATRELVRARTDTRYFSTGENTGPAGGLAAGIGVLAKSAGQRDWVVFIDDDDPPPSDDTFEMLTQYRRHLQAHRHKVAAVGCAGARFDRRTGRLQRVPDETLVGDVAVDYLGGGQCPMYSLAALADAGGPRPDLFFGFEELELGLRLENKGYQLFVPGEYWRGRRVELGRLGLTERQAAHGRRRSDWRRYYSVRNLLWIAREHGRFPASTMATLRSGLAPAVLDVVRYRSLPAALPALRGVFDAWRGRLGRPIDPE